MSVKNGYKLVSIETSRRCNLKCVMCPTILLDEVDKGFMSDDVFESILPHLGGVYVVHLTGGGETFLDKKIYERIKKVKQQGCNAAVTTHGGLLNEKNIHNIFESGLNFIRISFDGASKETYEAVRIGSHYEKVLANVKALIVEKEKRKSTLKIGFNYVVMKRNIQDVPLFVDIANTMNVDEVMFIGVLPYAPLNTQEEVCEREIFKKVICDAKEKLNGRIITLNVEEPVFPVKCPFKVQEEFFITYQGDVYPCCQWPPPDPGSGAVIGGRPVGNVLQEPLSQIWEKEEYARFRGMWENSIMPEDCTNCQLIKGFQRTAGSVEV